jgi:D-alanine-D-alanine ligase
MRVTIAYSAQRLTPDTDLTGPVQALEAAVLALGHQVASVPLGMDVPGFLRDLADSRPDVIWNLCEEASGRPGRELHAAALLELQDVPVTGSPASTLALCLDKGLCRHVLAAHGVPVPEAVRVDRPGQRLGELPLPAIVKPACQDGSVGIHRDSVGQTRSQVEAAVRRLETEGLLPALIERYIDGRELNVLLLGPLGGPVVQMAVGEIAFGDLPPDEPHILTYDGKWHEDSEAFLRTPSQYPAVVDPDLLRALHELGHRAFAGLHLSGYARLDVRVDGQGQPYVVDVNANPDVSPGAGLQRALPGLGLTFQDFVALQLSFATIR